MKVQTSSKTQFQRDRYKVGVSLLEKHYVYLKNLAKNRFHNSKTKTILYLIRKYNLYLYKISIMESKQTFTVNYQPKSKKYKRYGIWIDPLVWGEMNDLRKKLGYSMSFLLRIMLEWEMAEESLIRYPYIRKPKLRGRAIPKQRKLRIHLFYLKSSSIVFRTNYIQRIIRANFVNEFL